MATSKLLEAVAVTAELCGRTFTPAGAAVFTDDLSGFPETAVLKALTRCRREVKGMLTIQDVVSRIDDGRPGVEEAWSQMPFSESQSVVWTDEMCRAFGIARGLLDEGDKVAARMAFKEAYTRMVGEARDAGLKVVWTPSLGYDKNSHAAALSEAVATGKLSYAHAADLCPGLPMPNATILHIQASPAKTFTQLAGMAEKRDREAA